MHSLLTIVYLIKMQRKVTRRTYTKLISSEFWLPSEFLLVRHMKLEEFLEVLSCCVLMFSLL